MTANKSAPAVGICMGSKSDLPTMDAAAATLDEFGIAYEVRILSAHRTPTAMVEYGAAAAEAGLEVLIAGAGGAAHLPGMLAAVTVLPVIGVPVPSANLAGMDSLLSIVQMPRGTPVATVGIGNATNAAHLALRILAGSRPELRAGLLKRHDETDAAVREHDREVKAARSRIPEPPSS